MTEEEEKEESRIEDRSYISKIAMMLDGPVILVLFSIITFSFDTEAESILHSLPNSVASHIDVSASQVRQTNWDNLMEC